MDSYYVRLLMRLIASEVVPVSLRARLMSMIGFDVAKDALIWTGADFRSRKVTIGQRVFINIGLYYDGCASLVIEDDVSIGPHVQIITGTHEIGPSTHRCASDVSKPVRIGRGSWIGSGVILLPGITIGAGCIIAAGAVVAQSTLEDGMYAGVPARRVGELG